MPCHRDYCTLLGKGFTHQEALRKLMYTHKNGNSKVSLRLMNILVNGQISALSDNDREKLYGGAWSELMSNKI